MSAVAAPVLFALATICQAAESPSRHVGNEREAAGQVESIRVREGTSLERATGYFRNSGDRLTLHLAGGDVKHACLENLALERIAKIVAERNVAADRLVWEVSGVFTEYRGNNYLLVSHAVLKTGAVDGARP